MQMPGADQNKKSNFPHGDWLFAKAVAPGTATMTGKVSKDGKTWSYTLVITVPTP